MFNLNYVAQVAHGDLAVFAARCPLAVDARVKIGPFIVPAALASASPAVPNPLAAAVLATFLSGQGRHSDLSADSWLLVASDESDLAFVQRIAEIGVRWALSLSWRSDKWGLSEGYGLPLTLPGGEKLEPLMGVERLGSSLEVAWDCGLNLSGTPLRVLHDVAVSKTQQDMHIRLTSSPNPALAEEPTKAGRLVVAVAGTGGRAVYNLNLSEPAAIGSVYDDSQIPPLRVA